MRRKIGYLALGLGLAPGAALAADICPDTYICASNPEMIVTALRTQGYKAQLKPATAPTAGASSGTQYVDSAAGGYGYEIDFKDCTKGADCQSMEFLVTFAKDGANTPEMANAWNRANRFSTMYVLEDGALGISYDLSTAGGVSQVNFADAVDWWANGVMGHLKAFFDAHPAGKGKKKG